MFSDSYPLIQRLLHWIIAIMIIGSLAAGTFIGQMGFNGLVETVGQDLTNMLYKYHKTFGVIILGLMVIRVACRAVLGSPAYSEPLTTFEKYASITSHVLLYVAMLAMPILGWLATAAGGFPVEFFDMKLPGLIGKDKELSAVLFQWHGIVGWALIVLISVHILAAMRHWIFQRDRVMGRISLF